MPETHAKFAFHTPARRGSRSTAAAIAESFGHASANHARPGVHRVITDLGVLDVTRDGLRLAELAPGVTLDELRARTDAKVAVRQGTQEVL